MIQQQTVSKYKSCKCDDCTLSKILEVKVQNLYVKNHNTLTNQEFAVMSQLFYELGTAYLNHTPKIEIFRDMLSILSRYQPKENMN